MNKPKFQMFKGEDDKWYFRLKAPNGKIVAQSEGYNTRSSCFNGIESVQVNAPKAAVIVEAA